MNFLMVFVGGGCGSVLRYAVALAIPSASFPWATLCVNAFGSLAIGLLGGWSSRFGWSEGMRLAITVGLCGGFTTFSTFSKESLELAEAGRWCAFGSYVAGSVILGLAAVALGYVLARQ
ncbi:MAG: fluoride efflux transporter CrcB [Kiritimatiellae bacterium]|nr:fluoride efflux transporter CrcB [Kiritimatiellia bacterium]